MRFCSGRARPCCRVLVLLSVLLVFWGVVAVGGSLGAFGGIGDARSHLKRERGQGYWCVVFPGFLGGVVFVCLLYMVQVCWGCVNFLWGVSS